MTMYCRWLLRILTSAARPMGFPAASASRASIMSGTADGQHTRACGGKVGQPAVSSIQTGWAPVRWAICSISGK